MLKLRKFIGSRHKPLLNRLRKRGSVENFLYIKRIKAYFCL